MNRILNKMTDEELNKIIKYYYLDNITNDDKRQNLIEIISNNLYIDDDGYLKKKDYENRYLILKGSLLNGNNNSEINNELNLF
jgi:hypothetical protein